VSLSSASSAGSDDIVARQSPQQGLDSRDSIGSNGYLFIQPLNDDASAGLGCQIWTVADATAMSS
jgi:hypothetical protein